MQITISREHFVQYQCLPSGRDFGLFFWPIVCFAAVWREMVAMQRRGTNVVVGEDRQKLGAKELHVTSVVKRNRKQITAVLISLTVFAILLSKCLDLSKGPCHCSLELLTLKRSLQPHPNSPPISPPPPPLPYQPLCHAVS